MNFNLAQTFFVDPSTVANAPIVGISSVDLYFKSKPSATNNKSGIQYPGVTVYLVPTINSIPNLDSLTNSADIILARVEFNSISASADASLPTRFSFTRPISVDTGLEFAILVAYDGNEDFLLWTSKQGDLLYGTTKVSPGPSGKYIGNYYSYLSSPSNTVTANMAYASTNWNPSTDTDLKFNVYVARYAINGVPVSANTVAVNAALVTSTQVNSTSNGSTYTLNAGLYEYVMYDRKISKTKYIRGGEHGFQMSFFYPGGSNTYSTVSVISGSSVVTAAGTLPNGAAFNWNSVFSLINDEYIIVNSLNHDNMGIAPYPLYNTRHLTLPFIRTNVRKVLSIDSNTSLTVDQPFDFSNSVAAFYKAPVGRVDYRDQSQSFGVREDIVVLSNTNANSTVRFVNNVVEYISIAPGATGYNNSDILIINGFEAVTNVVAGGYSATANLVTNSSGGLTFAYLTNCGAGFVNSALIAFVVSNSSSNNSTSNTSNGTGAVFTVNVGATIGTEFWGWNQSGLTPGVRQDEDGGWFGGGRIVNMEIGEVIPHIYLDNPTGTTYNIYHQSLYYSTPANTFCGKGYFYKSPSDIDSDHVSNYQRHQTPNQKPGCLASRSNEFCILHANGATNNTNVSNSQSSNSVVVVLPVVSNNDFQAIQLANSVVNYSKYIINNDYTAENTNYGNALARHISTKVNFSNGTFAEDAVVYITAYKPPGTDIQIFSRIYNSTDDESFDDKDWTRMKLTSGNGLFSSSTDPTNYIELTYGFQPYPNTAFVLKGGATTQMGNAQILGSGTTYSTNASANLNAGDLIRLYQPLFTNNYIVAVVNSISSDTLFDIVTPIANAGLVGAGLKIDLIGRVGNSTLAPLGYPLQAFNNITNDNVVRYFSSTMIVHDTYNTLQVKIVELSNNSSIIPKVDDLRFIGTSS